MKDYEADIFLCANSLPVSGKGFLFLCSSICKCTFVDVDLVFSYPYLMNKRKQETVETRKI